MLLVNYKILYASWSLFMTKTVLDDGKVVDFCSDLQVTGQSKHRDVRCIQANL